MTTVDRRVQALRRRMLEVLRLYTRRRIVLEPGAYWRRMITPN